MARRAVVPLPRLLLAVCAAARPAAAVRLTVAAAQLPVTDNVTLNRDAILRAVAAAEQLGADYLVTPEGSLSGYFSEIDQAATDAALQEVTAAAARARVGLFLGTIYNEPGPRNTTYKYDQQRVFDTDGTYLGFNAKQLLTTDIHHPGTGEAREYVRGKPTVFRLKGGVTAGALICNDMWADPMCSTYDPMLTHVLASQFGARIVFHSVNGGPGTVDIILPFHNSNLQYRARADGIFIVAAQAAQADGQNCNSGVVGPDGKWLAQAALGAEVVVAHTIDIDV